MLKALLPQPINISSHLDDGSSKATASTNIPSYGSRQGWLPQGDDDFGDGGAYPEIHVVQYPYNMGKPQTSKTQSNSLIKQLDIHGNVAYSALSGVGHYKGRVNHSKISDLMPQELTTENDPSLMRPGKDEVDETTERTKLALLGFANETFGSAKPIKEIQKRTSAQYIRYTPAIQGMGHNSGASQRIIRMVEAPLDPLEPPRFKTNKKIPRPAPSPPAPVLHSPPRKLSQADQQRWKIPPCISNWRNPKGYTIPLDKRLAADGRGLQETIINENFAKMSESLYIADRKAREAIEMRNSLEKKMAQREKEKKEQQLRQMAQEARENRSGIVHKTLADQDEAAIVGYSESESEEDETIGENLNAQERDELRRSKKFERRRERNLMRAAPERRAKIKAMDADRDISEQIALGLPSKKKGTKEIVYDQRLFNQSSGLDTGFDREDDTYNVYTSRWNETGESRVAKSVYRPKGDEEGDMYGNDVENYKSAKKFVADRGFEGATGDVPTSKRTGPVQFEKDRDDPFGLDDFLDKAKGSGPSSAKRTRH